MASRQLVAQIGVFAILGLNVGAYYAFWPHRESENRSQARPQPGKGQMQLLPPTPLPDKLDATPTVLSGGVPLLIDNPPAESAVKPDDDPLARLLQHIQKEQGHAPIVDAKAVRAVRSTE